MASDPPGLPSADAEEGSVAAMASFAFLFALRAAVSGGGGDTAGGAAGPVLSPAPVDGDVG